MASLTPEEMKSGRIYNHDLSKKRTSNKINGEGKFVNRWFQKVVHEYSHQLHKGC